MVTKKDKLTEFVQSHKYFSVGNVRDYFENSSVEIADASIYKYLQDLQRENEIFDAGKGWYSTLQAEFKLDTDPVNELVEKTDQEFPDLDFCVWSTEQLAGYYHHLPTKFSTFLHTKKTFLSAMTDYFRGGDYQVLNNPGPEEMDKQFFIEENPLVIRPRISEEPRMGHYAMIQKILVDLWKEKDSPVIDTQEYKEIFKNLVMEFRINVAKLLRYADRRSCKEEIKNILMAKRR